VSAPSSEAALEFAEKFAAAWAKPVPEELVSLLHPDVVLLQPHRPPVRGRDAALREFHRLLRWVPGLHGVIERSSGSGDLLFIEWQMRLPVGRDTISIRAVDRFFLEDALGRERRVYFDQLQFVVAVLRHPSLWRGYLRYRFGR